MHYEIDELLMKVGEATEELRLIGVRYDIEYNEAKAEQKHLLELLDDAREKARKEDNGA